MARVEEGAAFPPVTDSPASPNRHWNRLPPTPASEGDLLGPEPTCVSLDHSISDEPVMQVEQTVPNMALKRTKTAHFEPAQIIGAPPRMRKRQPSLSRSNTLSRLQDQAREEANKMNYYAGFNHHNWFLSIRWIFKGSGKNVFLPLLLFFAWSVAVVVVVETLDIGAICLPFHLDLKRRKRNHPTPAQPLCAARFPGRVSSPPPSLTPSVLESEPLTSALTFPALDHLP